MRRTSGGVGISPRWPRWRRIGCKCSIWRPARTTGTLCTRRSWPNRTQERNKRNSQRRAGSLPKTWLRMASRLGFHRSLKPRRRRGRKRLQRARPPIRASGVRQVQCFPETLLVQRKRQRIKFEQTPSQHSLGEAPKQIMIGLAIRHPPSEPRAKRKRKTRVLTRVLTRVSPPSRKLETLAPIRCLLGIPMAGISEAAKDRLTTVPVAGILEQTTERRYRAAKTLKRQNLGL
mmetsp:Transcript_31931/g.77809  ORF Transcript_31931/g.77809 Transcript_31931/m.77809 type:complete len:232 (-) Transcript_31931:2062-2757(-)